MLFKRRKAQGLSITVIIIAVIALLVLVILALIFTGSLGTFIGKTTECENKGGKCALECGSIVENTQDYPTEFPDWKCPDTEDGYPQKCCVKFV